VRKLCPDCGFELCLGSWNDLLLRRKVLLIEREHDDVLLGELAIFSESFRRNIGGKEEVGPLLGA
jgi:hypothetical protein